MTLIENVKNFFAKKNKNEEAGEAPEGVCPNCWGAQEWEGEYYQFMKGHNGNPSTELYDSFIKAVVRKLGPIVIQKSTLTCETCKMKYDKKAM